MCGKTKPETATVNELVCGFEVCLRVMNFNVIGHYTNREGLYICRDLLTVLFCSLSFCDKALE